MVPGFAYRYSITGPACRGDSCPSPNSNVNSRPSASGSTKARSRTGSPGCGSRGLTPSLARSCSGLGAPGLGGLWLGNNADRHTVATRGGVSGNRFLLTQHLHQEHVALDRVRGSSGPSCGPDLHEDLRSPDRYRYVESGCHATSLSGVHPRKSNGNLDPPPGLCPCSELYRFHGLDGVSPSTVSSIRSCVG